jgi:hypothetical protein
MENAMSVKRLYLQKLRSILLGTTLFIGIGTFTDSGAYAAKAPSSRMSYVGATPGKKTRTGRVVLQRWHQKGKAKWIGSGTPDYKKTEQWQVHVYTFDSSSKTMSTSREWRPLDSKIAMGHKLAAVDYWNKGAGSSPRSDSALGVSRTKAKYKLRYAVYKKAGRDGRAKSRIVRRFMLDPDNYRFEDLSANSSFGAKMTETYQPPRVP